MSSIWKAIGKTSNKPFVGVKELSIDEIHPSVATTTNIDKLLEIHDRHIFNNIHKNEENNSKDTLELFGNNENKQNESETLNKTTSILREIFIYIPPL